MLCLFRVQCSRNTQSLCFEWPSFSCPWDQVAMRCMIFHWISSKLRRLQKDCFCIVRMWIFSLDWIGLTSCNTSNGNKLEIVTMESISVQTDICLGALNSYVEVTVVSLSCLVWNISNTKMPISTNFVYYGKTRIFSTEAFCIWRNHKRKQCRH